MGQGSNPGVPTGRVSFMAGGAPDFLRRNLSVHPAAIKNSPSLSTLGGVGISSRNSTRTPAVAVTLLISALVDIPVTLQRGAFKALRNGHQNAEIERVRPQAGSER